MASFDILSQVGYNYRILIYVLQVVSTCSRVEMRILNVKSLQNLSIDPEMSFICHIAENVRGLRTSTI